MEIEASNIQVVQNGYFEIVVLKNSSQVFDSDPYAYMTHLAPGHLSKSPWLITEGTFRPDDSPLMR